PFDLAAVEGGVLVGHFEGGAGAVDAGYAGAMWGKVEGEAALIAEGVEGLPMGVARGGGVVLALVEEGSGFLTFERVIVEADAVHVNHGRGLRSPKQAGLAGRQLLQVSNAGVDTFD